MVTDCALCGPCGPDICGLELICGIDLLYGRTKMPHTCHARGCSVPVPPEFLMCNRHWYMVPEEIRDRIWKTYRRGQCDDKNPSEAWHQAADDAICAVYQKEQKGAVMSEAKELIQAAQEVDILDHEFINETLAEITAKFDTTEDETLLKAYVKVEKILRDKLAMGAPARMRERAAGVVDELVEKSGDLGIKRGLERIAAAIRALPLEEP